MLLLPFHLIQFWYVDGTITLIRIWRNLLFLIEEDMAISLMARLLFVPLFHDASFVGRILSLVFRVIRIISGLVTVLIASVGILLVSILWFLMPLGFGLSFFLPQMSLLGSAYPALYQFLFYFTSAGLIFGIALFMHHLLHHPVRKLWQIKSPRDIWQVTRLKPSQTTWEKLVENPDIKKLLKILELDDWKYSVPPSTDQEKLAQEAFNLARDRQAVFVAAGDFFIAYLKIIPELHQELVKNELSIEDFIRAQEYLEETSLRWRNIFIWNEDFHTRHLKGVNRGWLGAPTPELNAISTDLTELASVQYLEDFIGRQEVVNQLLSVLSQDTERNALLVGEAGVGKSTLVYFLAKMIVAGDAPSVLATKRLVKLEIGKVLSGVTNEGEMAQKIKAAFEEVERIGDIIVFIDEIHELGIGDAGKSYNLYSLLTPYLESNSFQFIASTEPNNYARIIEKEGNLARLFHKIEVTEATTEETLSILKIRAIETMRQQGIITSFPALQFIATKAKQFIHDRKLPDSALYLFSEAKTRAVDRIITEDTVKKLLSQTVNVLVVDLDASQKEVLLHLEEIIHKQMIDQEQAVTSVADTLRRASTSLREENRPIGSFLFVGPTGVGKTELAKILSETYFKQHHAFVRFDMSEYQTSESVNRLIGDSENPGELTEAIKNKPYCLILLDEFEKANPHILMLFLQILEDGRLTGGDGKTVDFTNTIIIATSNVGSLLIAQGLDQGRSIDGVTSDGPTLQTQVREELLKVMRPELVNRFDSIVIFKPLSQFDLESIVQIKLKSLKQKLLEKGYVVEFSNELISELARRGYDPVLGARPLRRLIQDTLEAHLSKLMLTDKLQKGSAQIFSTEIL